MHSLLAEAEPHAPAATGPTAFLRALLASEGAFACGPVLAPAARAGLADDVRRAGGPVLHTPGGGRHAVALLAHSDAALALLDDEGIGGLVDAAIGDDALLGRADGVLAGEPHWRRGFDAPLRDLPSRAFRPGVTAWIALSEGLSAVEIMRSSHNLQGIPDPGRLELPRRTFEVGPSEMLLLEAGAVYRLARPGDPWITLEFVRPWIKPQLLLADALGPTRVGRLGARGRRWCGQHVGLPQSVEEFLAIEEAALTAATGLAKGSGI